MDIGPRLGKQRETGKGKGKKGFRFGDAPAVTRGWKSRGPGETEGKGCQGDLKRFKKAGAKGKNIKKIDKTEKLEIYVIWEDVVSKKSAVRRKETYKRGGSEGSKDGKPSF